MKKTLLFGALATCALFSITSCNQPTHKPTNPIKEEITKIEEGLYSMTFRDDYVEKYIKAGGGDADQDILDFAKANISDDEILERYQPITSSSLIKDACSSFNCLNSDNEYIHCRELDLLPLNYQPMFPSIIMHNIPKKGYESIAFTSFANMGMNFTADINPVEHEQAFKIFELIPIDGINSAGLAVNINDISNEKSYVNQNEEGKTHITTTILVRLLLNKAKNVDEAIKLIQRYNLHDSDTRTTAYHLMISDKSGASCIIEFFENKIQIIRKAKGDKIIAMTNTEVNENFPQEEGQGSWKDCPRYKALIEKFNGYDKNITEDEAIEVLKAALQNTTTHTIVYNLSKKSVYFCRSQQWEQMHFFDL